MLSCGAILILNHLPPPHSHECLYQSEERQRISDGQTNAYYQKQMKVKTRRPSVLSPIWHVLQWLFPSSADQNWLICGRVPSLPHSNLQQKTLCPICVTDLSTIHKTAENVTIPNESLSIDLLVIYSNSCYVILNGCYPHTHTHTHTHTKSR